MPRRAIRYIIFAYISGSILYANVFAHLLGKKTELLQCSEDGNPGTANAFKYCGFWCGVLTLAGDLAKGFFPVYLYLHDAAVRDSWALPLVIAAPVVGHAFPIFHRFFGGKGIAATFGVLLGLYPYGTPVLLLAAAFILLSTVLRVDPTFYRTITAYLLALAYMAFIRVEPQVWAGFAIVTGVVCLRMHMSKEVREKPEVKLLWRH